MSQNTFKATNTLKAPKENEPVKKAGSKVPVKRKILLVFGLLLISLGVFCLVSLVSYLFTGMDDQSLVDGSLDPIRESGKEAENWAGLMGAYVSHFLIFNGLGYAMLMVPIWLFNFGYRLIFRKNLILIPRFGLKIVAAILWISVLFGNIVYTFDVHSFLNAFCGAVGYEMAMFLNEMIGFGSWLVISIVGFSLAVFVYQWDPEKSLRIMNSKSDKKQSRQASASEENSRQAVSDDFESQAPDPLHQEFFPETEGEAEFEPQKISQPSPGVEPLLVDKLLTPDGLEIEIGSSAGDKEIEDTSLIEEVLTAEKLQEKYGLFDPTLELSGYKFPPLELLQHHGTQDLEVNTEEIEFNKNRILETLQHYNITIANIKATVGPTVTLFEIVPDAGIRISKIKGLEDDIAMSLEALKIRIIAPIPGKGTIGIEVPTKNRVMVSTRSVLATEKFMKSDMDLPIVLGKSISNEVFITDLAKMPHLLVAGATGQGKSVGINVLLTSLLYKKHPSQLKLVLVDPKKVELALYSKLERHFLAALPDAEECIITDTKKVVNTLNSLCIEMDTRYNLLKDAGCRNIKEYNQKFTERRLNPENGHRFLPFIVLVIDELADLMMTAGKEVETPIARLAQLARAIGIHLIVATQRPSVNVITGIIKANFPARLSFKVTSKIDSRTILDQGGADQLVSGGDMLLSLGSDIIRIQCPFISTAEVEGICDYIGNQRGYEMAYLLPEAPGDETGSSSDFDPSELDPLLEEAARLIVAHQQGSTSLIQRKMKLGYNRAGRLIDQMESLGIVGPFEGSKARQVLVDEYQLERILNDLSK